MLDFIPLLFMILFYGGIAVVFIILIIRRIEEKRHEDFEKRDN